MTKVAPKNHPEKPTGDGLLPLPIARIFHAAKSTKKKIKVNAKTWMDMSQQTCLIMLDLTLPSKGCTAKVSQGLWLSSHQTFLTAPD